MSDSNETTALGHEFTPVQIQVLRELDGLRTYSTTLLARLSGVPERDVAAEMVTFRDLGIVRRDVSGHYVMQPEAWAVRERVTSLKPGEIATIRRKR